MVAIFDGALLLAIIVIVGHYRFRPKKLASSNIFCVASLKLTTFLGFDKITDILIKAGANVNALNNDERTPLFFAVVYDSVPVANLLIQNGAQVNAQDKAGDSILAVVVGEDSERYNFAEFLLNNGADPNLANDEKKVPLHIAVTNGYARIVELLIQKGSNVNFKDEYQTTPLHFAANNGNRK